MTQGSYGPGVAERQEQRYILLVDDDLGARSAIHDALEDAGFEVISAGDAPAAIEAFDDHTVDLALLSAELHAGDGFELAAAIRQRGSGATVPIVMMADGDDVIAVRRAFELGLSDFIARPFNLTLLAERLRYVLRATGAMTELERAQAQIADSQRVARLGSWDLEFASGRFDYTDELHRLFCDVDESRLRSLESLLARVCDEDRPGVMKRYREALDRGENYDIDFRLRTEDGDTVHVFQATEFEHDEHGEPVRALGIFQDVSEARASEARMRELAFHDPVTGLPNRVFFMERLSEVVALARRSQRCMALMFVDLDQFKRVNDTLGHQAGDELLVQVSKRLTDSLRRCDALSRLLPDDERTLARLGGDEFVILLSEIRRPDDAAIVAHRLLQELKKPFSVGDKEVQVSGSIGISTYPQDGTSEEELLRHADLAMYRVKEEGRNGFRFYESGMNSRAFERLNLETSLWRAFERGEFALHYQPQVAAERDEVIGAEALVRWEHPDFGTISPGQFLPVAEEIGLMAPLGEWVVEQACYQLAAWHAEGIRLGSVSVNLSATQYQQSALREAIQDAVKQSGIEPHMLCVELGEGMLDVGDLERMDTLHALRDAGIHVAVDDFGTGQASLAVLRQLPIDSVKIHRGFVREIARDHRDAALVKGAIELGHALDLSVVAAGVEDAAQLECLVRSRCDTVQGYHFSPAVRASEFGDWLNDYKRRRRPGFRATA